MQIKRFAAGELIFAEADPADNAYVVEYGNVKIFREVDDQLVRLAVLGKGDIFGEMGLVGDRPRSASARAVNDVAVTPIGQEEFIAMLYNDPDATVPIIRALFERLRMMNERYLGLLENVPEAPEAATSYRVKLVPQTPQASQVISRNGIEITEFPFRIGREPDDGEHNPFHLNDLSFPEPGGANLSLSHFSLEQTNRGMMVEDRGSHHGTLVNAVRVGGLADETAAILRDGQNEIIAGADDSPFKFRVVVEPRAT